MLRKNVNRGGGEGGGSYSSDITVPNVTVSNYLRTVYTVLGRWGCYSSGITVPNVTVSNPHATPYIVFSVHYLREMGVLFKWYHVPNVTVSNPPPPVHFYNVHSLRKK